MNLKDLMKNGKVKGVFVKTMAFPAMVILTQQCGMDFIFYDGEHGILDEERLHDLMVLGNCNDFPTIVRVPELSKREVSRILDYGATGVMVPMIETKEEAEKLAGWSKYPPIGRRSYSSGANTHYDSSGAHSANMVEMNERTIAIVQIETVRGIENIEEILSVDGIDAIIVGPCDLANSMGNPDYLMDEKELEMIQRVSDACKKYQKPWGIIGKMNMLRYFKDDLSILIGADDLGILRAGLKNAVKEYEEL